jgi:L-tyrosine isonitrile synthase
MEENNLMTPWHGVAVRVKGRIDFVKRAEAEALGAKMILEDGRPSHFELMAVSEMELVC